MLYDDLWLDYSVRMDSSAIAYTYQLGDRRVPLNSSCVLRIGLRHHPVADITKYYIAGVNPQGGKYSVGGTYKDGFMETRIRELGSYTVAVDTVPPVITPINSKFWARSRRIVFRIRDRETGIRSYLGKIDGKYALFGIPNAINGSIVYVIDTKRVERGKKHVTSLDMPDTSNVLQYFTEDGTKVSVRPSGTEPKIKFYFEVKGEMGCRHCYSSANAEADEKIKAVRVSFGI